MWFFWIVAREMESIYGSRDFLVFYLCAADLQHAGMGVDRCRVGENPTRRPMVGASGAVMATVMLFTLFYPRREILLFFIPMPMWVLLTIYLVVPVDPRSGEGGSIGHRRRVAPGRGWLCVSVQAVRLAVVAAVLGAGVQAEAPHFLAGPREQTRTRSPNPSRTSASVGSRGQVGAGLRHPRRTARRPLDEVLAKIAREGRSGLTEEELRVFKRRAVAHASAGATGFERPDSAAC